MTSTATTLDSGLLSQWFTDPRLALAIVGWALKGRLAATSVLEPSAGDGAFVGPLVEALGPGVVTAVEIDPAWAGLLADKYPRVRVITADFLQWEPGTCFGLAVMNSPYEYEQDLAHVRRALDLCRTVVALVRVNFLCGVNRHEGVWGQEHLQGVRFFTNRPRFSGAAGSSRYDYCCVKVGVDPVDRVDVGWWSNLGEPA